MSDKCPTCDFPLIHHPGMDEPDCSEFCIIVTDEQKKAFKTLKDGDFGVFPCKQCGCAIEDEYSAKDPFCSGCWKTIKPARRILKLELELIDAQAEITRLKEALFVAHTLLGQRSPGAVRQALGEE